MTDSPSHRDRVIDQVRKLRDRARRDVGPEATAAARKARELVASWNLTEAELRASRPPAKPTPRAATTTTPIEVQIGGIRVRWDGDRLRVRLRLR